MAKNKIIKTTNGKRHISNWPTIDKNRKPTANQIKARERFSGWIKKVKELMEDDDTKKIYAAGSKNGVTAYNVALADVVNKPVVTAIIANAYNGKRNDVIIVQAKDDFKVKRVEVSLSAGNVMIEKGEAIDCGDGVSYIYTAVTEIGVGEKVMIAASAFDIPGNEGSMNFEIKTNKK